MASSARGWSGATARSSARSSATASTRVRARHPTHPHPRPSQRRRPKPTPLVSQSKATLRCRATPKSPPRKKPQTLHTHLSNSSSLAPVSNPQHSVQSIIEGGPNSARACVHAADPSMKPSLIGKRKAPAYDKAQLTAQAAPSLLTDAACKTPSSLSLTHASF